MRKKSSGTDEMVHGWRLIYTLRGGHSSMRGDMTAWLLYTSPSPRDS